MSSVGVAVGALVVVDAGVVADVLVVLVRELVVVDATGVVIEGVGGGMIGFWSSGALSFATSFVPNTSAGCQRVSRSAPVFLSVHT